MPRLDAKEKQPVVNSPLLPVEFEMRMRGLLRSHEKFPRSGEDRRAIELAYLALRSTEFAAGAEVLWEILHGKGAKP